MLSMMMLYIKKLFKQQEDYFDVPSQDLTPRQIREKLAQLALNHLSSNSLAEFKALLTINGGKNLNGGTGVTDDLKYNSMYFSSQKRSIHPFPPLSFIYTHPTYINSVPFFKIAKFSRQNGIHVSPTVMWDGLVANEVSSGWEQQDWVNFFESKVVQ